MKKNKIGKQAQTSCRHCLVATQETISEAIENKTEGDETFVDIISTTLFLTNYSSFSLFIRICNYHEHLFVVFKLQWA